jgi:YggT family protein
MDSLLLQIFNIVTGVAMLLLFIRFMMQLTQVDPYNPIVMSTIQATRVVDIFNRILPTVGQGRVNLAALGLMVLVRLVDLAGNHLLNGVTDFWPNVLLLQLIFGLLDDFLMMCKVLIYVSIISSLVLMFTQNNTPIIMLAMQMTEPLYAPFRRFMPDLGPLDLSPIVALLAIYIARAMLMQAHVILLQGLM